MIWIVIILICFVLYYRGRTAIETFKIGAGPIIYVDVGRGNDNNNGTYAFPYKTIQMATDKSVTPQTNIQISDGTYPPFKVINKTSLRYHGSPKTIISTATVIPNVSVNITIFPFSKAQVYFFVIPDDVNIGEGNLYRGYNYPLIPSTPLPELLINGERLPFARWPAQGVSKIAKNHHDKKFKMISRGSKCSAPTYAEGGGSYILDLNRNPDKLGNWTDLSDIWVSGVKSMNWIWNYNKLRGLSKSEKGWIVTLDGCEGNYLSESEANDWQIFENVKYELYTPGFSYVDRKTRTYYFIPTTPLKGTDVLTLNAGSVPLMLMSNCKDMIVDNIIFDQNRTDAVVWHNCLNSVMLKCTITNILGNGIKFIDCAKTRLTNSTLKNIGMSAVTINARPMLGGQNLITSTYHEDQYSCNDQKIEIDNVIMHNIAYHDYSIWAIVLDGIGNSISECTLSVFPYGGIYVTGSAHLIEKNDISKGVQWTYDMGMIYAYSGKDILAKGTIIRNNYLHDMQSLFAGNSAYALYIDDGSSGYLIEGNYIENIKNAAVYIHGGHSIDFMRNYMVNCRAGVYLTTNNYNQNTNLFVPVLNKWKEDWKKADQQKWIKRFPRYAEIWNNLLNKDVLKVNSTRIGYDIHCRDNLFYKILHKRYLISPDYNVNIEEIPDAVGKPSMNIME